MFVIAETALVFIAEQVMDNAVFETARLIRTGQVQTGPGPTDATPAAMSFRIRDDGLRAHVGLRRLRERRLLSRGEVLRHFDDMDVEPEPIDDEDEFEEPGAFDFGEPNEIVVVRAYYQWPTSEIFGGLSLQDTAERQAADRLLRRLPQRAVRDHVRGLRRSYAMSTMRSLLRRLLDRRLGRLRSREERGIAAVEFSLILPIMIVLWIGGVEVTSALSVDRRLNNLASSIGDLVARSKTITYAQITDIFELSEAAMFPYSRQPACRCASPRSTSTMPAPPRSPGAVALVDRGTVSAAGVHGTLPPMRRPRT